MDTDNKTAQATECGKCGGCDPHTICQDEEEDCNEIEPDSIETLGLRGMFDL